MYIKKRKTLNLYILDVEEFTLIFHWRSKVLVTNYSLLFWKHEMDQVEIYEDTWEDREDE